jgi:hypothetical protein
MDAPRVPKSKAPLVVLIIAIVVVLAGAAATTYYFVVMRGATASSSTRDNREREATEREKQPRSCRVCRGSALQMCPVPSEGTLQGVTEAAGSWSRTPNKLGS